MAQAPFQPNLKRRLDVRMALWEEGFSDEEIARDQDVTPAAVAAWRKKRGLAPSSMKRREEPMEEQEKVPVAEEWRDTSVPPYEVNADDTACLDVTQADAEEITVTEETFTQTATPENTPAEALKVGSRFMLERPAKPDRMRVTVMAELLTKVAKGWPEAEVTWEDGCTVAGISVTVDYGPDGGEENATVRLYGK